MTQEANQLPRPIWPAIRFISFALLWGWFVFSHVSDPLRRDPRLLVLLIPLTPPFVFFGVSMGALVAYELTRALQRAGAPLPQQLFVAAYPAADLQNPMHAHRDALRQALGDPPDPAALARHGLLPAGLRDPEALRMVLPPLRADLEVVLHHEHRPGPPLPLPTPSSPRTPESPPKQSARGISP